MADPKYPEYNGVLRFDDDNVVEVGLQPDTENITVKLNGTEISGGGGAGLPEVDSSDNGDVLTVVEGEWTNAAPASQLPAVSGSDNGNVLTVVEGAWAKAAPAGGNNLIVVDLTLEDYDEADDYGTLSTNVTYDQIQAVIDNNGLVICCLNVPDVPAFEDLNSFDGKYFMPDGFDIQETDIYLQFKYTSVSISSISDGQLWSGIIAYTFTDGDPDFDPGVWSITTSPILSI